jgi:hypothetical protein
MEYRHNYSEFAQTIVIFLYIISFVSFLPKEPLQNGLNIQKLHLYIKKMKNPAFITTGQFCHGHNLPEYIRKLCTNIQAGN